MYQVIVSLENFNKSDKAHLLLADCLLKEELTKLSSNLSDWEQCKKDKLYLYLIRSNNDQWRISLFPIQLSVNHTQYKYRAISELTVEELLSLVNNEALRHKLLRSMLPENNHSTVVHFFDLKQEQLKDNN